MPSTMHIEYHFWKQSLGGPSLLAKNMRKGWSEEKENSIIAMYS